jgi:hypothetical protein
VHASSNAPVNFFDVPTECSERRYWDGAVAGYNNPLMAAVVEALTLQVPAAEIVALSIGTGTIRKAPRDGMPHIDFPWVEDRKGWNVAGDLKKMAMSVVDDPPDAASYVAHRVLRGARRLDDPDPVVRLSPSVQPRLTAAGWEPSGMDEEMYRRLADLDMDAVEQEDVDLLKDLGELWLADAVANQPIRYNARTLECDIGQRTFSAGVVAWRQLIRAPNLVAPDLS